MRGARSSFFPWRLLREVDALERRRAKLERALEAARSDLRSARSELKGLRREVRELARYEYGSVTPGIRGWDERWRSTRGLRILMFATKDYAGSLSRAAEAINRCTRHAARCVICRPHPYGYAHDLVLPRTVLGEAGVDELLAQADLVHLKDEVGFLDGSNMLPPDLLTRGGKPIVHTQYGGLARRYRDDPAYQNYVRGFAARLALTPDLCFPWSDWILFPFPIDARRYPYAWRDGRVVAHSPSTPERKGTALFLEATAHLPVEVDVIHGVSYTACLERKRHATLFFDQAGGDVDPRTRARLPIGWYGNSAVEAAVFGIPTIAHLSPEALANAERAGFDTRGLPLINTPPDARGLRAAIEDFFARSRSDRARLSTRTRESAERTHSYEAVAAVLERVYTSVAT